ncbi:MAG: transcription termination factor NusA [bacterium]|jgi:N utilization substance protein A
MDREFIEALRQISQERDIPLDELIETIESALANAYKRHFATTGDAHVRIDANKNDVKVYCQREVVGIVSNSHLQISLEEARKVNPETEIGDFVDKEVTPENFGRIAAQTAKQVVLQKLRETERRRTFDEYNARVGEMLSGVVQRRENNIVYVAVNKIEAILPPREQVPTEPYRFNDRIKVYVLRVDEGGKGPVVTVSRSHPNLLRRLFEIEVPEIEDETVTIKAVAREPGQRSKIAVTTTDERVDPIGACVGHRGARVQAVVNELYDEKIDIIRWMPEPAQFIADSLSPAKVASVTIDEVNRSALVIVAANQLSLAIGKGGQNVRLAARLTDWRIDIRSDAQPAPGEEAPLTHTELPGEPQP